MRRYFGLMPNSEVSIEKSYKDKHDLTVRLQAGEHGWTIIWADGGTTYNDVDDTPENNFKKAYDEAVGSIDELTEISGGGKLCCGKCTGKEERGDVHGEI